MSLPAHVLLSIVFAVASSVNHIDDTDETHGYYEPVHYLLYGTGLQTWEYSPEFALRSYAFLTPFVAAGTALHALGFSKLQVFYGIRIILSQFMAYAVASLTHESKKVFGPEKCGYFVATLIFCPGLFFCSSAFLPSAVCCGLAALAMSSLMSGHHGYTILYGCLAVLWTGWPFIGLIFLPMGYTILHREIEKGSFNNVFRIAALGIIHVASISVAVLLLDSYYYGRR